MTLVLNGKKHRFPRAALVVGTASCLLWLGGCGTSLPKTDAGSPHLGPQSIPAAVDAPNIPAIVSPLPLVPPPSASNEPELYTVVAQDVPLRDLLFNLARDAAINVDVHPDVSGLVTLNAIDQTLPQILERLTRQSNIRWQFDESGNLVVAPDLPFWNTYKVNYVNVQREAQTLAAVSTSVNRATGAATGGGSNASSSTLTQTTTNNFWGTLNANLATLIGGATAAGAAATNNPNIVTNAESGVISVRATAAQHEQIAAFIKNVESRSLYQVLIEATVVEVSLSDDYQSGVNWETLNRNGNQLTFRQLSLSPDLLNEAPTNILTIDRSDTPDAINTAIALLSQFGELRVLSSPKIMALNNQAAMLRVVDNAVYFTIDVEPGVANANGGATPPVYTSVLNTVPIGFVMTVTPAIGEDDQVTLNVRPTISRIVRFVNDPNPILAEAGVSNSVPEISVREMESVLKVNSGQIAILGGLMQDSLSKDVDGLPVLSRLPGVRNLFGARSETANKTELIVFIRPVVIRNPSLAGDLQDYQQYLPTSADLEAESAAINQELLPAPLRAKAE